MTSSAPYTATQHAHTPPARETFRVGDRVHVLGTRRATVITPTDTRGFTRVLPDNGTPAVTVTVAADVLVPISTVSNVKTSELLPGDVVATGAGWVRLTGEVHKFDYPGAGVAWAWDGRVLGLAARIAAGDDDARWVRGVNRGFAADDQWTVQGNDLARWTIEQRP